MDNDLYVFSTNYRYKPSRGDTEMSDELITEQTGYMSTEQLVHQMVLAGQRLYDYRHGLLDIERELGEEDDEEVENQYAGSPYAGDPVDEEAKIKSEILYRESRKKPSQTNEKDATSDSTVAPGEGVLGSTEKPVVDNPQS